MSRSFSRAVSRLGQRFDRHYLQLIQAGLCFCIWFSVFAHAAHDLWAANFVFANLTFFVLLLFIGHSRTQRAVTLPYIGPVLLFLTALAVSTHYSYDFTTSRLECWVWLFSFIGFYLLVNSAKTPEQLDSFFDCSSYALIPLAIISLSEQISGASTIHATLINSNILSGFVLYWVIFIWNKRNFRSPKIILLIALVILLIVCRSWSGYLSLLIGMMYYYRERIKILDIKIKIILGCFAAFALLSFIFAVSFGPGLFQLKYYSVIDRLAWWIDALKMARQHPLVGVGLGAYAMADPYFQSAKGLHTLYAHSFPLQLLSETGFLGALSFLWLAFLITQRIQPRKVSNDPLSLKRDVFLSTLITVLCFSLTNINLDYFLNKLMLLFILVPLLKESKSDIKIQSRGGMALGAVLMTLLIPSWMRPWRASIYFVNGTLNEQVGGWATARASYEEAIAIDGSYADAYAGLARTYRKEALQTHSPADLAEWRSDMMWAFHYKKDIHFIQELDTIPR